MLLMALNFETYSKHQIDAVLLNERRLLMIGDYALQHSHIL